MHQANVASVVMTAWALSVVAGGCALDTGAGDELGAAQPDDVGLVQGELSGLVFYTWGGVMSKTLGSLTFDDGTSSILDLGVPAGQWACLLSGVWGNIGGGTVGTGVITGSGKSILKIAGKPGAALAASATCVPSPFEDVEGFGPNSGSTPSTLPLVTAPNSNTFCGLVGWTPVASNSFVTITNNGANPAPLAGGGLWKMTAAGAGVVAGCPVSPVGQNVTGMWDYHIIAPPTGTASFKLLDSNGNLLPKSTACFLTNVQGAFSKNDFNDGVGLSLVSGVWTFKAANGKSGWALCLH